MQLSDIDWIKQVKEAYTPYKTIANEFLYWSEEHKYQLLLYHQLEKLLDRKREGDLKESEDIPSVQEMEDKLHRRKHGAIKRKFVGENSVLEVKARRFIRGLQLESFLEEFEQLNIYTQYNLLEEFARYLKLSKAGQEYLRNCALFNPSGEEIVDPNTYLYSFNHQEILLGKFENESLSGETLADLTLKIVTLYHSLLRDYYKDLEISVSRTRFITARLSAIFFENRSQLIIAGLPKTYLEWTLIHTQAEYELKVAIEEEFKLSFKEVSIKNTLKEDLGILLDHFQLFFTLCKFGIQAKALRDNPDLKNSLNFIKGLTDLTDDYIKFHRKYADGGPSIVPYLDDLAKAVASLKWAGDYIFAPILICVDLKDTFQAILDREDRAAWNSSVAVLGGLVGMVGVFMGLSAATLGFMAIGIVLIGFVGSSLIDSTTRRNLLIWLEYNYFGKQNHQILNEPDITKDPLDIRFEWEGQSTERSIFKQIAALHSILLPADMEHELVRLPGNNIQLNFKIVNPPLAMQSYMVKLRFFGGGPQQGEQLSKDLQVPLDYYNSSNFPRPEWRGIPANSWFERHELVLERIEGDSDKVPQALEYQLDIRLPFATTFGFSYYQIQFYPLHSGIDLNTLLDTTTPLPDNPFILSYAKAITISPI